MCNKKISQSVLLRSTPAVYSQSAFLSIYTANHTNLYSEFVVNVGVDTNAENFFRGYNTETIVYSHEDFCGVACVFV